MKRKFFAFILLLTAGLSLSSCLSSDDDTTIEYTHDTAITAFSLGNTTRHFKGVSSTTGKDTTLTAEVTGSKYNFYIDQATRQIYNQDSLPMGTKTSAVLATITAKQSSPVLLESLEKSDSLVYYSSSDSIDFSSPRKVRVYNNDFSAYVTYTITVNVHKEDPDSFVWHSLATQNAEIAALSGMKLVSAGSNVYLFGKADAGLEIFKTSNADGRTWDKLTPNVTFDADAYKNAISKEGTLYILNQGAVLSSTDGANWNTVSTDASLTQLIGVSSRYLYAKTATGISVSKDNGATWTAETLDEEVSLLPNENLSLVTCPIRSTKNAENLLFVGRNGETDSWATVWTRMVDYNEGAEAGEWNFVYYDANQRERLPNTNSLFVAASDSGYVAMGAGKIGETESFKWYTSKTGLTWQVDTTVVMPTSFDVNKSTALVRDGNNFYWIVNKGCVWKGRYNREGWRKE